MIRNVKIKIMDDRLTDINYASAEAAGVDLRACIDEPMVIEPGKICKIPTGIALSAEDAVARPFAYLLFGRSGLGVKHGITLANSVGVIDSDYRGEIVAGLINQSDEPYTVQPMERVAQLVLVPIERMSFSVAQELDETVRGAGGFGSTGK